MRVRALLPWVLLLALVIAPVAGVVALVMTGSRTPERLRPQVVAALAPATRTTGDDPVDVVLRAELGTPAEINSSRAAGLLTSVYVKPGDRVVSGDRVVGVDGVDVYAMRSAKPPYRELVVGNRGADVQDLERFLVVTGEFAGDPDQVFDSRTAAAVRNFRVSAGDPSPGWNFAPAMVVWLPTAQLVVGRVDVVVGGSAPGAGEALVTAVAPVERARLTDTQGNRLDISWPRLAEIQGKTVGTITGPDEIPAAVVQAALASTAESGGSGGPAAPADPAEPGAEDSGTPSANLVLRLPEPVTSLTVPASAVMVDASGARTCVWTGVRAPYVAVPVSITGGGLGTATVDGAIEGQMILGNPLAVLGEAPCPSS